MESSFPEVSPSWLSLAVKEERERVKNRSLTHCTSHNGDSDCKSPQLWTSFCVRWTHKISTPVTSRVHGLVCTYRPETQWYSTTTHSWPGEKTPTLMTRYFVSWDIILLQTSMTFCLQSQRAVNFIRAAVLFRNALEDRQLEPDVFHLSRKKSDTDLFRNIVRCRLQMCLCCGFCVKYIRCICWSLVTNRSTLHPPVDLYPAPSHGTWPTCGRPSPST